MNKAELFVYILRNIFMESFIYTYTPNVLGLTCPEACAILSEHNLKFNILKFDNINNYRVSSQNIKEEYVLKNTIINNVAEKRRQHARGKLQIVFRRQITEQRRRH